MYSSLLGYSNIGLPVLAAKLFKSGDISGVLRMMPSEYWKASLLTLSKLASFTRLTSLAVTLSVYAFLL